MSLGLVIEQNRCKDCLYSGILFTRAPTTLYDYFHFIHAYATTPFLEKNSEYGFFRGKEAQLVIPSNYLDDLIQNLWPMLTDKGSDDDKWEHILDVFFGEDRGYCFESDRLDYDDIDYDQWYTDELFKKQYNPNKSKLFPEKVIPKEVGL